MKEDILPNYEQKLYEDCPALALLENRIHLLDKSGKKRLHELDGQFQPQQPQPQQGQAQQGQQPQGQPQAQAQQGQQNPAEQKGLAQFKQGIPNALKALEPLVQILSKQQLKPEEQKFHGMLKQVFDTLHKIANPKNANMQQQPMQQNQQMGQQWQGGQQ